MAKKVWFAFQADSCTEVAEFLNEHEGDNLEIAYVFQRHHGAGADCTIIYEVLCQKEEVVVG